MLESLGLFEYGACAFLDAGEILPVRSAQRLPRGAKSVIAVAFPYFVGQKKERNIAKYAAGRDYHEITLQMLHKACAMLKERFPKEEFVPFCDASPLNERRVAYQAGLGVLGKNGMVIHKRFGSYFFIGEMVTSLALVPNRPVLGLCPGCMACIRACPGKALGENGVEADRCASHISQKKGELDEREQAILRAAHTVWGCDICQDVCPLNQKVAPCALKAFETDLCFCITEENLDALYPDRAFNFRKKSVIQRNLRILSPKAGENTTKSQP